MREQIEGTDMETQLSIKSMLDAGVHFGHQIQKWNPKMKPYVYTTRGGIHIINLQKTLSMTKKALDFVEKTTAQGGRFLFVGTKKQAMPLIRESAIRAKQFYVSKRWLGGTMTNFETIKVSIDRMKKMEQMKERGDMESYSKKERARMEKEYARLKDYLEGIRDMKQNPSALFVVDINKEHIAVAEALRLHIPVVALVDTNCNPEKIHWPIPGNDDATRSIAMFINMVSTACIKGNKIYQDNLRQSKKANLSDTQKSAKKDPIHSPQKGQDGPTVIVKARERKLVAVGTADDVEISMELEKGTADSEQEQEVETSSPESSKKEDISPATSTKSKTNSPEQLKPEKKQILQGKNKTWIKRKIPNESGKH